VLNSLQFLADWRDVDTLLPGPINAGVIKQRYGVNGVIDDPAGHFVYFLCRHQRDGCKLSMRWAKQGGLLQQHGQHDHTLM
jgi:hypothetical protein